MVKETLLGGFFSFNPFWERFICIEGDVKLDEKGDYYIELDNDNTLPLLGGCEELLGKGKRRYHGFLNYRDQVGYGDQKAA